MILWVDTETTGLDDDARLLEIACILTTDDLVELDHFTSLVKCDCVSVLRRYCRPEVLAMHEESGLWSALQVQEDVENDPGFEDASSLLPEFLELDILAWLAKLGWKDCEVPMAGSTVGFDRRVLRKWMPNLEASCHYRCIDVSTIKELYARWAPHVFEGRPQLATKRHRALDDVQWSIEELRYYRRFMLSHREEIAR